MAARSAASSHSAKSFPASASTSARTLLPEKFQESIDAAAMVAGLTGSDEYGEHWTMNRRDCGDDLQAEVDAEAGKLLAEWDDIALRAAIRTGGLRDAASGEG